MKIKWYKILGISIISVLFVSLTSAAVALTVTNKKLDKTINLSISQPTAVDAGKELTIKTNLKIDDKLTDNYDGLVYEWQIKKHNSNKWENFGKDTKDLYIPQTSININDAKMKLVAKINNQKFESNEVNIKVNEVNPLDELWLSLDNKFYKENQKAIISTNISINDFAIDDPSNIKFKWEVKNKTSNKWTVVDNNESNTLVLDNLTLDDDQMQIKSRAIYKNYEINSRPITIDVYSQITNTDDILWEENEESFDDVKNDSLNSIGIFKENDIAEVERNVQTEYYETELWTQYHDKYGFVYPSQKRNYESGDNRYFGDESNPRAINAMDLVFKERVPNTDGMKYNDARWIKQEIAQNTLKKHRAADDFYLNKIDDIPSTTKEFEISTAIQGTATLGLYVPPGEVVTVTLDDETFELFKKNNYQGLNFVINENYWDNRGEDDSGRISNRYPFLETIFGFNNKEKTLKIGSPFGGGLGIRINSRLLSTDNPRVDLQVKPIKFKVEGAIKCMYYHDGVTSKANFEHQIKLVKNNKLAPILQANSAYFSLTIPFNGLNHIGPIAVDNLKYPEEIMKKWNDFLFLSNYYARRDLSGQLRRLNMEYCDDIWGGAGAWGGGMTFYCPTGWGVDSMFRKKPIDVFNSANSWGVFHEINHNFQQDSAFFARRGHGETNQVSGFNLSVISDSGRFRNELNYSGEQGKDNNGPGWSSLNNPFMNIYDIKRRGLVDEYPIYAIMLFMLGSKKYADYVRWDVVNHPADKNRGWTGFDEIRVLSERFKLNMWPAFEDYGNKHWIDEWPKSTQEATDEQKQVIEKLKKYPAIDFIANHYATGNYMYNMDTGEYEYSGDVVSPFEIVAGQPKVFDFENFIISTNDNFNWTKIELESNQTKLGGSLKIDEKNPKKLIYTPPSNLTEVDEFDMYIIPGEWDNKPSNYVEKYKFKIKVRQVVNEPVLEFYGDFDNVNNLDERMNELINNNNPIYTNPMISMNVNIFNNNTKKGGAKIKFKFIAPEDGRYRFSAIWGDYINIVANNENIYKSKKWVHDFEKCFEKELKKGEVLDLEYSFIGSKPSPRPNIKIEYIKQSTSEAQEPEKYNVNLFNNVLIPNYNKVTNDSVSNLLNSDDYKFKYRLIDHTVFNNDLSANINLSNYKPNIIEPTDENGKNYEITSNKYNKDLAKNLESYDLTYFELWNNDHNQEKDQAASEFEINFEKKTKVSSLFFGHRTNNHSEARPTHIKVTGYDRNENNEKVNPRVLYDGEYGKEFNDRSSDKSILNLTKPDEVDTMIVEMYNERSRGLILTWVRPSPEKYIKISTSVAINNDCFKVNGNWKYKRNDSENKSEINNIYAVSTNEGDSLEIILNNAEEFAIIGQINDVATKFDVYVNDLLVAKDVSNKSPEILYNQILYKYYNNGSGKMKIKIVHKDKEPLYINYLMTFGKSVYASKQ